MERSRYRFTHYFPFFVILAMKIVKADFPFDIHGHAKGIKPYSFLEPYMDRLNTICEGNRPPRSCSCSSIPGKKIYPPFLSHAAVQVYFCKVSECQCHNGAWIDARPPSVKGIEVCSKNGHNSDNKVEKCSCGNQRNRQVTPAFNVQELFLDCAPTSCSCSDGSTQEITDFGCNSGGFPGCPAETGPLLCQDGSEPSEFDPLTFVFGDSERKGCICSDGKMPICDLNAQYPSCPKDLKEPDWKSVPYFLRDCRRK